MTDTRIIDRPEPGMWAIQLAKGGREVAARIFWYRPVDPDFPDNTLDRSPILSAEINGEPVPWQDVWLTRGRPISEGHYRYLLADVDWARQYAPGSSLAQPKRRASVRDIPIPNLPE